MLLIGLRGGVGSGKTTLLLRLADAWRELGKTVEGFVGGLVASAVAAILFAPLLAGDAPRRAVFATVAALAADLGDLVFSAIKRDVGCKDFRALLPAHGGLLDRFDSFLLSAGCCHLLLQAPALIPFG